MTILSAAQNAMMKLVGRRPAAVVSSQDTMAVELTAIALEAAEDIADANDWQALTKLASIAGNGGEAYPLPADYDRMVQGMGISSPDWPNWFFRAAGSLDEWTVVKARGFNLTPGWWLILGGQLNFYPVLSTGAAANFYYVSKDIFRAANGDPKAVIEQDSDSFVLDERLLTLALVWRWKAQKQMDYAEDMRLYEDALSQAMARDKGSRVIRRNASRMPGNVHVGWPWSLGGV